MSITSASHYSADRQETTEREAERLVRAELQRRAGREGRKTCRFCSKGIKAKWRWRADCDEK